MDTMQIKLDAQETVLYELEQAKKRLDAQPAKPIRHSRELSKVITGDFDNGGQLQHKDIEMVRDSVVVVTNEQETMSSSVILVEEKQQMSRKESSA